MPSQTRYAQPKKPDDKEEGRGRRKDGPDSNSDNHNEAENPQTQPETLRNAFLPAVIQSRGERRELRGTR